MYRLLIVDDEEVERKAFKKILEQEAPLIEVVGEATSGRQAIELVEALRPDIITMDIKMPGINGLEALKEIRKTHEDIKVIMLTAYDYFSYAQESVNLRSSAFLLKPVKRKEIKETMQKVIYDIEVDRQRNKNQLEIKEKLNSVLHLVEAELASHLMSGNDIQPELDHYMNILEFSIGAGYCIVANIDTVSKKDSKDVSLFMPQINNLVRDAFKDSCDCIVSQMLASSVSAFIPVDSSEEIDNIMERSLGIARRVRQKAVKRSGVEVKIGIGMPVSSMGDLYKSYNQALACIRNSYNTGESICHYDDVKDNIAEIDAAYPIDEEKELIAKVRNGDAQGSVKSYNKLCASLARLCHHQPHEMIFHLMRISAILSNIEYENLKKNSLFDAFKNLMLFEPEELNVVKASLEKGIYRIASEIGSLKTEAEDNITKKACEFILENFKKPITLDDVAKKVSVSPFYLSRVFKIDMNRNFSDYLTAVRLKEAKRLLKETDNSLKEIAYGIGYNDPDYFCKVFKKNTGLTPTEYRNEPD